MTKNNLPSFSLLLSLEKDTRGEVGINRVCSDTRGREEKSTLPIRNNPLSINSNTPFSVLFSIVQCTIIPRFSWQHCLPIIFVCFFIFWKGAVPKPSDWISLFVCLFVCLFTCLLERKGWPEVWWQEEDTPSDQQSTCSILLFFHFDFVFSCTLTAQ